MNDSNNLKDLYDFLKANEGRYKLDPRQAGIVNRICQYFESYSSQHGGIPTPPEVESDIGRFSAGLNVKEIELSGGCKVLCIYLIIIFISLGLIAVFSVIGAHEEVLLFLYSRIE